MTYEPTTAKWTLRLDSKLDSDLAEAADAAGLSKNTFVEQLIRRELWTIPSDPAGDYVAIAFIPLEAPDWTCDDCGAFAAKFAALDDDYRIRNLFCGACKNDRK